MSWRVPRVLFAVALGALAGLGFAPVFGGVPGPRAFLLVVGAVSVEAILVATAAVLLPRLPAVAAALGGATAMVLTAMLATGAGAALLNGPWQLLTGALPAEPEGPALATIVVVAGWSTLAAGLLAAYATNALAPLAPPLVCLLAALGLGASASPLPGWFPLAALALTTGLLVTGRPVRPSPAAASAAVAITVAAVTIAAAIGPAAPGVGRRPPADARALVASPIQPRSGVSPLQQYLALRNSTRPLKVTGTVSRPGSLLRMATLTRFDDVYWTVDGDYRRAGTTLPESGPATGQVAVTQQIRVEAGELDWLLAAGRLTGISVSGLGVDEATGDVTVAVDRSPPTSYTASSTVNDARFDEVLAADPVRTRDPITTIPPGIKSFLDSAVSGQPPGSDQLLALYRTFTGGHRFKYDQSTDADGGHGYYQIQRLLDRKQGTSEQYASAYAVMARHLGYDARVVMGFQPRYDRSTFVAIGPDVYAWVEVNFTGLGWITIQPSPLDNPTGTRPNVPPTPTQPTLDNPLKDAAQAPPPGPPEPPPTEDETIASDSHPALTDAPFPLLAVIGALLVLLAAATPVAKAVRRARRRGARSHRLAVLGAWTETIDRLREAGFRIYASQTTGDVVRLVTHTASAPIASRSLPVLAAAVDHASFAPEEPEPTLRAHAWSTAAHVHQQIRVTMTPIRRLGALLDPRPLLGNRPHPWW